MPLPAWLAATVQVPGANPATVLPVTLQVDGVRLLKAAGSCDDALALSVPVPPTATLGAAPKVMLWPILPSVKLCVACGAGS